MRLVLDTSAYSHFRHGHARVLDTLAVAEVVFVPTVVLGELAAAFERGRRSKENVQALAAFLEESFVEVTDVTAHVAR